MTNNEIELSDTQLFRNVKLETIEPFLKKCGIKTLAPGAVLLSPARENTNFYLLLSGRLAVHLDSVDSTPLTILDPGECAGEMSIIEKKPPSAYVVAAEESKVMVIDQEALWAFINVSHDVACNLLYILSGRLRSGNVMLVDTWEVQRHTEHLAVVDALTGLHNRRWLDEVFEGEIRRCKSEDRPLVFIMLDLDHFKQYNDTYGHLAGDQALRTVANVLQRHVREGDMVARYGGEEFAILLPETKLEEGLAVAKRLGEEIAKSTVGIREKRNLPPITASQGVVLMVADDTLETLIAAADSALYRAKARGRNRISQ